MSLIASCYDCGKKYKFGDDKAGKKFKCKACNAVVEIPYPEDEFGDDWGDLDEDYGEPVGAGLPPVAGSAPRASSSKSKKKKPARRKSKQSVNPAAVFGVVAGLVLLVGLSVGGWLLLRNAGGAGAALDYALREDQVAFVIRPARMLDSPLLENAPLDDMNAEFEKQFGVQPGDVDVITLFASAEQKRANGLMPSFGPASGQVMQNMDDSFGVVIEFNRAVNIEDLVRNSSENAQIETASHSGKSYLKITGGFWNVGNGQTVAAHQANEKLVVMGSETRLKNMLSRGGARNQMTAKLDDAGTDNDFLFVGLNNPDDPANKSPQGMAGGNPMLSMLSGLAEFPTLFTSMTMAVDLSGSTILDVSVEGKDSESADKMEKTVTDAVDNGRKMLEGFEAMMAMGGPAPASGSGPSPQEGLAMAKEVLDGIDVDRSGLTVAVSVPTPSGLKDLIDKSMPKTLPFSPGGSGSPLFGGAGSAPARSKNNLKRIGLAWHNYHDTHKRFPPAQTDTRYLDEDGRPFLSWRVYLLPYVEHGALYNQFHFDEPWDSPHNKALIARMPQIYKSPDGNSGGLGKTRYLSFEGDGAILNSSGNGSRIPDIKDGTTNTAIVIEAPPSKAVTWTKPEDLPFSPTANAAQVLGAIPAQGLQVLLADGHVRTFSAATLNNSLKALVTIAGGEPTDYMEQQ